MVFMDVLLSMPAWLLLLLFLVLVLYLYGSHPYQVWNQLGVRGPAPSPFMGNVSAMFDENVGFVRAIRQWQKQYGRVFGVYFFRKPILVITDPDVLKQVFIKDFNSFVDRFMAGGGDLQQHIVKKGVFFEDGANWKRIRRIMTPSFSSEKIKMVTHFVNLTARRLGQNFRQCAQEGTQLEAKKVFGAFTLDVICGTAFGLDTNSQQNFEAPFITHAKSLTTFDKAIQVKMGLVGMFPVLGKLFKLLGIGFFVYKDVKFFEDNITALIQERKKHPELQKNVDLLQLLMNAEADPADGDIGERKLSTEEIAAQGIIFIIGGYETTSTTLQFLAYELARNPKVQDRLVEEMDAVLGPTEDPNYDHCQSLKYMEAAIKETLRMYPPLLILTRLATRDTVINDINIPAGCGVFIPMGAIGRDPELFQDPDTFRPERFMEQSKEDFNPIVFAPFGHGPRHCIGMRLAIMELKIALVHVLRNVRIVGASPEVMEIVDYSGLPVPKYPIRLTLEAVR